MKSILVKLPNWLGDILFSFDLLNSLCKEFERVGVCTSQDHASLFDIFPFPKLTVISYAPQDWPYLTPEVRLSIRDFRADACLLLPNSFGSALAMKIAGAKRLCGYSTEHRQTLLHKTISTPAHKLHQADYYLNLLRMFGVSVVPYDSPVPQVRGREVLIHPSASKPPRAWLWQRFLKLGEELRSKNVQVTFVSREPLNANGFPVLQSPSLRQLTDAMRQCALFIGNDSGPMHLAQQCGAPVVGIYGPGDPLVTGPRNISPSRVVYHSFICSPCRQNFFKECSPSPNYKPFCIETITTQEVLKAAVELLNNRVK